jgi:hypothetical protein
MKKPCRVRLWRDATPTIKYYHLGGDCYIIISLGLLWGLPRIINLLISEKIMLKTFNAILKNNSIQWLDQTPDINLDSSVEVKITFLEEETSTNATKSNGQKMSEALNKLAKNNVYSKINPQKWQQEIRQDRSLPNRD